MSHLSSISTKITNKELLIQACKAQSEVTRVQENYYIRYYNGQTAHGDIVAILGNEEGSGYDLGFNWNGSVYMGVADFAYGACNQQESKSLESLWQRIIQTYSALDATNQASTQRGLTGANVTVSVH